MDPEYIKKLKNMKMSQLDAELNAVTAERAAAKAKAAPKSQLDELDEKHLAATKALTAVINGEVAELDADKTRPLSDEALRQAKLGEEAEAEAARLAKVSLQAEMKRKGLPPPRKSAPISTAPVSTAPVSNGGRRRRSRKTRRYARRIR